MSTKIYTGIKINLGTNSVESLHLHFEPWRKRIKNLAATKEAKFLAETIVSSFDLPIAVGKEAPKYPMSAAKQLLYDAQNEIHKTGYRNPKVDFEFKVIVLPHMNSLYGIVYCEHHEWIDEFKKLPSWIEDYSFWDNTDRPDELTDRQWQDRRETWNAILPGYARPSDHGVLVDCSPPLTPKAHLDDVMLHIPDFEARVQKRAFDLVRTQAFEHFNNGRIGQFDMGGFFEAESYTKAHPELVEMVAVKLRTMLPVLTKEAILGKS